MCFKLDPTKPAQEVIFSRKLKNVSHLLITFKSLSYSKAFRIDFGFKINYNKSGFMNG